MRHRGPGRRRRSAGAGGDGRGGGLCGLPLVLPVPHGGFHLLPQPVHHRREASQVSEQARSSRAKVHKRLEHSNRGPQERDVRAVAVGQQRQQGRDEPGLSQGGAAG